MALYFLEYDLRKQRDYKKLNDELVNFGAVRILKSLWCFNRFNTTSKNLREHFKQFIDKDDGLIVAEVSDWASINVESSPNKLAP
jgi:hypothetical protein